MVYNEPDWNYRVDRRRDRSNRSDRIWVHERPHSRSHRLRAVRRRGNLPRIHRSIPQAPLDVISFDHGYFTQ